ncbi:MAG: general secretion pathway protein GspE [Planctomycetaceae bacterium]|nr:general secretion pathway protein GspE [Planctomycetaceae bacterium]
MAIDVYRDWLGIPESVPRPLDHYQLLRVAQFEDDADKIRAHYKKLNTHVRKYATGQYSNESQDLLNELAKAMLCLTDADRKRDYDESLGREFAADVDAFGRQPLLDTLIKGAHLSREQKRDVEQFASARGLSERDAVVQMKLVDPAVAAQALAGQLGYSFVELDDMLPEDSALDLVPRSLVKKHVFIPLFIDDERLLVACIDELDHELEEELRLRYGVPVRPVIATPRSINQAIAQYYAPGMRDEAAVQAAVKAASQNRTKEKPKAAAKPRKEKKSAAPSTSGSLENLSETEQEGRKQIGILMLCASVFLPMLPKVAEFSVPSYQLMTLQYTWLRWIPFAAAALSFLLVSLFVFRTYWGMSYGRGLSMAWSFVTGSLARR